MTTQTARAHPILLLACLLLSGLLMPASAAGQGDDLDAWATAFPESIGYDLPAMALPADAFPVPGLVTINGRMLRPVEEAAAFVPVLGVDEDTLLEDMRGTGWVTRHVAEVVRPDEGQDGTFERAGWSSITAHESPAGALEGFALLDESQLEGVEVLDAPGLGDASRLTRYAGTDGSGRSFERIRLTFVVDHLVGSVAFFWYDEARVEALEPEAMLDPGDQLLERMQAVMAGDAPSLPGMIVRLNPTTALPVASHGETYYVLDGALVPHHGDSEEAITAARRFNERFGVESNYILHTNFKGQEGVLHRPTWLVALYRVEDAETAAELVRQHARYDQAVGYDEMVELDTLPAVDWPVAGSAYTEAWEDGSTNRGYRLTVAVGSTVAIVDVSAPGGVSEAVAFDLVEAQAACLEFGECAPVPAPFPPTGTAPATPAG